MRRQHPFAGALLGALVALVALLAVPGLGISEPSTSHSLTPSDVFTTTEPEICAETNPNGALALPTQVDVAATSNLLVYFSAEWSGLEIISELLVSLGVKDESGPVASTPFEWGLSTNPGTHESGTLMWSFDNVEPGTYTVVADTRVDRVAGSHGGGTPSAVLENCALTVFVSPAA